MNELIQAHDRVSAMDSAPFRVRQDPQILYQSVHSMHGSAQDFYILAFLPGAGEFSFDDL